MSDRPASSRGGWFKDLSPEDLDGAATAITDDVAEEPQDWSSIAVESGYVDSEDEYYERLHETTIHVTRREVRERERADDQQLKHAIRAMDDIGRLLL
jgi:nucleolar protein 56